MDILKSRRLWTFIIAQVVAIATLIANHYLGAGDEFSTQLTALIISTVEGLAGILIAAYTTQSTLTARRETEARQAAEIARINRGE